MENEEVDFPDQDGLLEPNNLVCNSIDDGNSLFDEIFKSTRTSTCTHTHTCNPPGPDNAHTHTCYHTHTRLFASAEGQKEDASSPTFSTEAASGIAVLEQKKRSLGNREAVRKYREKKKAHTAYLEEQVSQLRSLNQQLTRRLRGHAALEAEVTRLRALLSDFGSRINAELGSYPYQKPCDTVQPGMDCFVPAQVSAFISSVPVPCDANVQCLHSARLRNPQAPLGASRSWKDDDLVSERSCELDGIMELDSDNHAPPCFSINGGFA